MIERALAEHPELKLTRIYVDDGVTGTLMDRPEWNRLMHEVYAGKVQCIIVKDPSRFGRNYVETGYYAQHISPKLSVRFISCVDDIDTETMTDDLPVKIKNVVNDIYARDISKKMVTIFNGLNESGELVVNVPYGFKKNNKKKIVVDSSKAPIVRMIFAWAEMGVGPIEIADRLTLMGVARPADKTRDPMEDASAPWSPSSVWAILQNHSFTGTYVSGKRIVRMHKEVKDDRWVVIPGHHEAIITEERYENVQKMLGTADEVMDVPGYHPMLDGKLFCAVCGSRLILAHQRVERYRSYYCGNHTGMNRTPNEQIPMLKAPAIKEGELLLKIEEKCAEYEERKKEIRKIVNSTGKVGGILNRPEQLVVKAKQELDAIGKERITVFEAYAAGRVGEMEHITRRAELAEMSKKADVRLEECVQLKGQMEADIQRVKTALSRDAEDAVMRIELQTDGSIEVHFAEEETIRRIMG